MARSLTRTAVAFVSRALFASDLHASGFRRRADHAHRESGGLIHGINFQASRWGSAIDGQFTVNLLVTSPFLFSCWTGQPFPSNPASASFPISQRIGFLMPGGLDHWWQVAQDTDLEALSAELRDALRGYGLPFFQSFPDAASLLGRLRRGEQVSGMMPAHGPLVHAMLAKQAGFDEEARDQLRAAHVRAPSSGIRFTVELIATRLAIRLSST